MRFLRILLFTVCIVSLSQVTNAQNITLPSGQTLTKAPWYEFDPCFYNFSSNTIKAMSYEYGNGNKSIEISIYNNNGSIWKQFTLTPPVGYSYMNEPFTIDLISENNWYMQATDDYFNNDDLVEVLVSVETSSGSERWLVLNENNKVVIDFGDFEIRTLRTFPAQTGGYIYLKHNEDVYILNSKDISGINSVLADNKSGSVSPNPSNGAASVEVSWDYTLLDDAQLNVVDMDGKLVHTQIIKAGYSKTSLSTSRFSSGTYIYIVHGSNGYTSTGKFVIN